VTSTIRFMVVVPSKGAGPECVFLATAAPATHFVRVASTGLLTDTPTTELGADVVSTAPVVDTLVDGSIMEVLYHDASVSRHMLARPPSTAADVTQLLAPKPRPVTTEDVPQNASLISFAPGDKQRFVAAAEALGVLVVGRNQPKSWRLLNRRTGSMIAVDRDDIDSTPAQALLDRYDCITPVPTDVVLGESKRVRTSDHEVDASSDSAEASDDERAGQGVGRLTLLMLRRSYEGAVAELPPMWRVRRFGN